MRGVQDADIKTLQVDAQVFVYRPKVTGKDVGDYITGPYTIKQVSELGGTPAEAEVTLNTQEHWIMAARKGNYAYTGAFRLVVPNDQLEFTGGGLRVKEVAFTDQFGKSIIYEYGYRDTDGGTSGATYTTPGVGTVSGTHRFLGYDFRAYRKNAGEDPRWEVPAEVDPRRYREHTVLPGSGIQYGRIVVTPKDESGNTIRGKSVYEYYTPRDLIEVNKTMRPVFYTTMPNSSTLQIHDYSSITGMPKGVTYLSRDGEETLNIRYDYEFSEDLPIGKTPMKATGTPLGMIAQRHKSNLEDGRKATQYKNVSIVQNNVYQTGKTITRDRVNYNTRVHARDALSGSVVEQSQEGKSTSAFLKVYTPAYYRFADMASRNMLTQSAQLISYEDEIGPLHAKASGATEWKNGIATAYNVWRADSDPNPNFTGTEPESPSEWIKKAKTTRLSENQYAIETENAVQVPTSYVRGHNDLSLVGRIANAYFDECGILTGDYDQSEIMKYNYKGYQSPAFDAQNGWRKGGATLAEDGEGLWGNTCIKVVDNYGPTRSFRIYPNTDYIMSAWVKVKASTENNRFVMGGDYRKTDDTGFPYYMPLRPEGGGPTDQFRSFGVSAAKIQAPVESNDEKWQYVELRIPAISDLNNDDGWYALVFYGTPPSKDGTIKGGTAYLQDLRFYPADAVAKSTYYDESDQRATLKVDPNGKPSRKVTYDGLGRVRKVEKAIINNDVFTTWVRTAEQEYGYSCDYGITGIELISPNGAEQWVKDRERVVLWNAKCAGDEKILLKVDGALIKGFPAAGVPVTHGRFVWTPDAEMLNKKMTIEVVGTDIRDVSDKDFHIRTAAPAEGPRKNDGIYKSRMGDVNGDGIPDLLRVGEHGVRVYIGRPDGFEPPVLWSDFCSYDEGWRNNKHLVEFGDFNGDGALDVIGFGDAVVAVGISNGLVFETSVWHKDKVYNTGWRIDKHPRLVGDFDGDGKDDIVAFGDNNVNVMLSEGDTFSDADWHGGLVYNDGWRVNKHPRMVGDFDGDGKDDIIAFGNDAVAVGISSGSSFNSATWHYDKTYSKGWRVQKHPRLVGDFDGDGKDDIVAFGDNNVSVMISTGTGFTDSDWYNGMTYAVGSWRVDMHPRKVGDFNGDGVDDIIGFGSHTVQVGISTKSSFSVTTWDDNMVYNHGWRIGIHPRMVTDVNQDGASDIIGLASYGHDALISSEGRFLKKSWYRPE